MQSQAPLCSNSSTRRIAAVARLHIAAALLMTAVLAATTGCGSGMLAGPATQNTPAPVASAKGPQLGYLWVTSDKTLRPILGVSGASQIGQSVVPAGAYVGAAASALANIAVLQDADGAFDVMSLPSGSPASLGLTLPSGASIRLSPSANAALVYTPGSASASLITGLPSAPVIHSIAVPGAITESAVSDTGAVSFSYAQASSLAVAVMALDGRFTTLATIKSSGGLNFLPGRDDLLYADAAANSLSLVRTATTAPSASVIQTSQLLKAPTALGVSGSGRWALVVNASAGSAPSLVRVDLSTLTSTAISCSCRPTLASTLADDGAFRITDAVAGPNWIVDAAQTTPRLLFIPALPASARTSLVASAAQ